MCLSGNGWRLCTSRPNVKNFCFIKCYFNTFVLCNWRVVVILSNFQIYKCSHSHDLPASSIWHQEERCHMLALYQMLTVCEYCQLWVKPVFFRNGCSRSLTAKIKCRGRGTVEFVHILALSKRAAAKFRQLPPACHPVRN